MSKPAVLIVEDEAVIAADLSNKIRQMGYEVAGWAGTGEAALTLARQQHPALVLMDIHLAGALDGIAAAKALCAERDVPVLFLTAHSDGAMLRGAQQVNASGYLVKPVNERDLHIQIELALYRFDIDRRLRESHARLATLVEATFEGIVESEAGRITDCNEQFARMVGYSVAELVGMEIAPLIAPEDRERIMKNILLNQEAILENGLLRKDGTRIMVEGHGRALIPGSTKRHAAIRDITAHKQAEEAQARLALAVEQTTDSVVITDPTGAIVYTNPAFERISGYTRTEALGQHTRMLKSGKHDAAFYEQMWALLAAGIPWQGRLTNRRKDGSLYDEESTITPVLDAAGQIVNYVAVNRDVTALVSIEAQRRQYEKVEALGRMAGAIAHHFNNKLQVVVGSLEQLQHDTQPEEPAARCLGDAMRAVEEAAKISGLMLTYLGQAPSESKPLDLTELCRRSMPILRASIPMVLETDFACPGPVINANANQVQQVLTNLVTNAWEASRSNQGSVSISLKVVAADTIDGAQRFPADWHPHVSSYACLTVRDTGCGIAEAHLTKLFDPFFSTKFTGRGLGLAVVLGIVKAQGGVVTVESTPGQGSSFHVYFPVIAMAVTRPPEPVAALPEFAANGTVLVVEDEEPLLKLAGYYLRSLGFTVLLAQDGVVALDLFRQHPADVRCVISDVVMPRMDGWQTLEALRQLAPNLPVILASGYDEATVMNGTHAEMPQAFLSKPYTRDRLRAALARVLAAKQ